MKANYPPEIEIEKCRQEVSIATWIEKAWKKISKSAPPGTKIIMLAHDGEGEMSIKGNTCQHASHSMLSAALDLNSVLPKGLSGQECGDEE